MPAITSATDITRSIETLIPTLRTRRPDIERARRMPSDIVDQLCRTGVFSLAVPRALGGLEATPLDMMRAIETAALADGSIGWTVMIGLSGNLPAGNMDQAGAREVFTDPSRPAAGLAAPAGAATRVNGGVTVSGRWPFASGITHCDWVWAGAMVMENGRPRMTPTGPDIVHVWMPTSDVTIHDTWHVSGLCGTGSNDFSAADVFIPERRIFRLLDTSAALDRPVYKMPPLSTFALLLASVSLGIARAALDELMEVAQTKVPTMYQVVLAEKAMAQTEVARAEAALAGARAALYAIAQDIWDAVSAGKTVTPRHLAMARVSAAHAVETGAAVARTANTLAGGSALYTSSPMQRHARDAEAITHHFTVAPHVWEDAGRVLFGRQPIAPAF